MGKAKIKTANPSVPNRHLYSRVNYLYQAAKYLETASRREQDAYNFKTKGNSRYVSNQLQSVALKSQIRLAPAIKHSICKKCQSVLEEGVSVLVYVENPSRGSSKPWADVLVRECKACGTKRRFPVGAQRQIRREQRVQDKAGKVSVDENSVAENPAEGQV